VVGLALRDMPNETIPLKDQEEKNKWSGRHDERKRPSMVRTAFNKIC
jgi:hypothetical protein